MIDTGVCMYVTVYRFDYWQRVLCKIALWLWMLFRGRAPNVHHQQHKVV